MSEFFSPAGVPDPSFPLTRESAPSKHLLSGIDGGNPLGFLAALGALRAATEADATADFRLGWQPAAGAWRPWLACTLELDRNGLVELLHRWLAGRDVRPEFDLGAGMANINVAPETFREFALRSARTASPGDRATADYAAAYGCDAVLDRQGRVENTALRTMSGSGHQHFLGFMRNIIQETALEHLDHALFEPWRYEDPLKNLSLRWDPQDDIRYGLRWDDPSTDSTRKDRGSMLGANRLAIEALPLLPSIPDAHGLRTVGFRRPRRGEPLWRWPVWEPGLSLAVVKSVLTLPGLHAESPPLAEFRARGIAVVLQSARVRPSDYYRNFAPAVGV